MHPIVVNINIDLHKLLESFFTTTGSVNNLTSFSLQSDEMGDKMLKIRCSQLRLK